MRLAVAAAVLLLALPAAAAEKLPDGEVATGEGAIAAAWLIEPTMRYRHGVLGDAIEAGGLAVRLRDGRELVAILPPDSVFEDRYPRLYSDRIVLVRSYLDAGAAVSLWGLKDGELALLAESAPIGSRNRWLNPIHMADFDGDGADEIAAVVTPHLAGLLTLYRQSGTKLEVVFQQAGYSNHVIGSRDLARSAVADFDGDGVIDIAVPGLDHRSVHLLSLRGGTLKTLKQVDLPGRIDRFDGPVGGPAVQVRAGGRVVVVRP
ncbi:MAG: VCBS repeat-containing protein [Alphaproteobacteria bacterium]